MKKQLNLDRKKKPRLAITMGDPGGIGPEIILKALSRKDDILPPCELFVIGDLDLLGQSEETVKNLPGSIEDFSSREDINFMDMGNVDLQKLQQGEVQASSGQASMEYIRKSISLAEKGEVSGVVTGPINKKSLHEAGHKYPGHTEIFAEATGTKNFAMMMTHGNFRVVVISTHLSLSKAIDKVKQDRIKDCINLTQDALKKMGVEAPSLGIAGLNPHAGESGLFGTEEIKEIDPAVDLARKNGINVKGPFPPDTIFTQMKERKFDAVIAMYHDQGLIPFKLLNFLTSGEADKKVEGVNVTLGLPFVRTSVDHGVAYDIVGKGIASPHSLIEAIELATELSE